jgi:hypothetical protein
MEGVVVVGSILLAFAIDAAWDARTERGEEDELVNAVLQEMGSNQAAIGSSLERIEADRVLLARFLGSSNASLMELPADSVRELVLSLAPPFFLLEPRVGASQSLLAAGRLSSRGAEAVRRAAAEWLAASANAVGEHEALRANGFEAVRLVARHAMIVDNRTEIRGLLSGVTSLGPNGVAILRDDLAILRDDLELSALATQRVALNSRYRSFLLGLSDLADSAVVAGNRSN